MPVHSSGFYIVHLYIHGVGIVCHSMIGIVLCYVEWDSVFVSHNIREWDRTGVGVWGIVNVGHYTWCVEVVHCCVRTFSFDCR